MELRDSNGNVLEKNEYEPFCMCTGFLIEGGIFVTARHCIENALTQWDDKLRKEVPTELNYLITSHGYSVRWKFIASSYDGKIQFEFASNELTSDISDDIILSDTNGRYRWPIYFNGSDYAFYNTGYSEGLAVNYKLSKSLETAQPLFVLGYGDGMSYRDLNNLRPYFNNSNVKIGGLHCPSASDPNKLTACNDGFIQGVQGAERGGNSGGPVFTIDGNKALAIGIVSGARLDENDPSKEVYQVYTPIGNIKQ
jgi:hypothetical protein